MYGDVNGSSPVEMNSLKGEDAEKVRTNSNTMAPTVVTDGNNKQVNAKEMRVYYTGDSSGHLRGRGRLRTKLEQYLIILCVLLICACVAFMVIAFFRDRTGKLMEYAYYGIYNLCFV